MGLHDYGDAADLPVLYQSANDPIPRETVIGSLIEDDAHAAIEAILQRHPAASASE
jgi:hypothetical protein